MRKSIIVLLSVLFVAVLALNASAAVVIDTGKDRSVFADTEGLTFLTGSEINVRHGGFDDTYVVIRYDRTSTTAATGELFGVIQIGPGKTSSAKTIYLDGETGSIDAAYGEFDTLTWTTTTAADVIDTPQMADSDHGDFTYVSGVASLDNDVVDSATIANGDYGDFTFTSGIAALDADVVDTTNIADGDHGDFTYTSGVAALDADVVDTTNIADGDHGFFTYASGVASPNADSITNADLNQSAATTSSPFSFDIQANTIQDTYVLFYAVESCTMTSLVFSAGANLSAETMTLKLVKRNSVGSISTVFVTTGAAGVEINSAAYTPVDFSDSFSSSYALAPGDSLLFYFLSDANHIASYGNLFQIDVYKD